MARAFDNIKQGLNEAIAHAKSKGRKAEGIKLYQPHAVDVSSVCSPLRLLGRHAAALGTRGSFTQRRVAGVAERD